MLLIPAAVFTIAVVGFFKYEGFIASNINAIAGMSIVPDLDTPLPIGISFYTLQALSYVVGAKLPISCSFVDFPITDKDEYSEKYFHTDHHWQIF